MRRISLLLLCFIALNVSAQKATSIDSLYNDFVQIYRSSLDKEEHFGAMLSATQWTLRPENSHYKGLWQLYSKQFNINNKDSLSYRITDTVLQYFQQKDMWGTLADTRRKHILLLSNYTEAICPCFSQKLAAKPSENVVQQRKRFNFQQYISECETELAKNKELAKKIGQGFLQVTVAEQRSVQTAIFLFFYDNCPAYKKFWADMFGEEAAENTGIYLFNVSHDIDKKIFSLYTRKKTDSLKLIFPAYTNYIKHIEASKDVNFRGFNIMFGKNNRNEVVLKDTLTYFTERTLQFQQIFTYSITGLELKVFSYEFYTTDKVKDKKGIVARMKDDEYFIEPPPPPIPELRNQ